MTSKGGPGHNDARGALRFLTELIAWVAVPWALWPHSAVLAISSVLVLVGLPAVFGTPGDRPGGGTLVAVPGIVTILLVLIQLVAATTAAWVLWPWWAAAAVTVLCLIVPVTERPRWHRLAPPSRVKKILPTAVSISEYGGVASDRAVQTDGMPLTSTAAEVLARASAAGKFRTALTCKPRSSR